MGKVRVKAIHYEQSLSFTFTTPRRCIINTKYTIQFQPNGDAHLLHEDGTFAMKIVTGYGFSDLTLEQQDTIHMDEVYREQYQLQFILK